MILAKKAFLTQIFTDKKIRIGTDIVVVICANL
jgi:hypothetical protein